MNRAAKRKFSTMHQNVVDEFTTKLRVLRRDVNAMTISNTTQSNLRNIESKLIEVAIAYGAMSGYDSASELVDDPDDENEW